MREPRRKNGFTVLEVIVVLGIIGIVGMIASIEVSNAVNKANLDEASGSIRSFLDAAKAMSVREGSAVTVSYAVVDGKPEMRMAATNGTTRSLRLPGYVRAALNPGSAQPSAWPVPTPAPWVICDTLGRTLNAATGAQVSSVQMLSVTHRGMLDEDGYAKVRPRLRYDIQVFPLWQTSTVKRNY